MNFESMIDNVIEGDCLDIMPHIPPKSIDMVLCDLPYGTTQNKWDSPIDLDKLWTEYTRIIKDNGVIVLTSQGKFTAKLILSRPDLFKYKLVWIKSKATNFLNAKRQPLRKHEDICVFYDKQPPYHPQMNTAKSYDKGIRKHQQTGSYGVFNPAHIKSRGQRYPTDVIYFKTAESEGKVYHSTQKPVSLGRYLIRTYTDENCIVLDNACGSGSFLVSARLENRHYIGIEKNQDIKLNNDEHIDLISICNKRLDKLTALNNQTTLEDYLARV